MGVSYERICEMIQKSEGRQKLYTAIGVVILLLIILAGNILCKCDLNMLRVEFEQRVPVHVEAPPSPGAFEEEDIRAFIAKIRQLEKGEVAEFLDETQQSAEECIHAFMSKVRQQYQEVNDEE